MLNPLIPSMKYLLLSCICCIKDNRVQSWHTAQELNEGTWFEPDIADQHWYFSTSRKVLKYLSWSASTGFNSKVLQWCNFSKTHNKIHISEINYALSFISINYPTSIIRKQYKWGSKSGYAYKTVRFSSITDNSSQCYPDYKYSICRKIHVLTSDHI